MRSAATVLAGCLVAAGLASAVLPGDAVAQSNSCQYRFDGECDEGYGTGLCAEGSDSWDCRRAGTPPGPDSCIYARDGECDEPGGTGICIPYTDTTDCRRAGIDPSRVFFGQDERIYPDSAQAPWRMIGRITYEAGGHCSGTLVGPSSVLTAAHCMFGGDGPRGLDTALEFIAGASGSTWVERARVIDFYIPPQFDIELHSNTTEIDGYDWAFLTLDRPIGNTVGWMVIEQLATADLESAVLSGEAYVMQGGYSGDSKEFLSANLRCPLIDVWDDNTVFHECDTLQGDSGSPLFVAEGGRYRIVAVESATYPNDEGPYDYNMAVDARAFWPISHKFTN